MGELWNRDQDRPEHFVGLEQVAEVAAAVAAGEGTGQSASSGWRVERVAAGCGAAAGRRR